MTKRVSLALGAALLASVASTQAFAWGATGHYDISSLAMTMLPDALPDFLRADDVAAEVGELGVEPDRIKGAGQTHDFAESPGHYVDIDDSGHILGGPTLADLPGEISRRDYDTALRAVGSNEYTAGYLPFVIVAGFQQLREDFAIYRGLVAAQANATADEASRYTLDLQVRQMLILHDIGLWSHYIGDGSQPLHVSVHFDGWGDYPNPDNYPNAPGLHARFEGSFVRADITPDEIAAAVPAAQTISGNEWDETIRYLTATYDQVIPLYRLEAQGAFDVAADPAAGEAFITDRLAAAVGELRDLIVAAWDQSADEEFGYPTTTVQQIENGADPFGALFGLD